MSNPDKLGYGTHAPMISLACNLLLDTTDKYNESQGVKVRVNLYEFEEIMETVIDDLLHHYPHIEGHSGVKWAGHIVAAIAEKNPIKFEGFPEDGNPQKLHEINVRIAFIFAFKFLYLGYKNKILKAGYVLDRNTIRRMRPEVYKSLVNALVYKNHLSMSGHRTVNPVIMSAIFEQILEVRYPNVELNGSGW